MVSLGACAKDELHIAEAEALNYDGNPLKAAEAEALNYDGNPLKATLATLKMSAQPTVSLGGFEITPSVVLFLKCGSGPVYINGQHLVAVEEDAESEDEEKEDVKLLSICGKWSAPGGGSEVQSKKVKLPADEDDDDDFDDEETEEKAPVKKSIQDNSAKNEQKSNQNGKDSKPSNSKIKRTKILQKQEKTPTIPKGPHSIEDIKAKMKASIEKAH
ncbi:Nucleophosmin [Saguinus oedipus]|uniref:Nucleophosmin n=1 Tax=Saguinus oedipus TaxID=9490 RepID=A0ABQ9UNT6_SAGOE|nr:Nucleophosmin [Saguinus oedipus]